MPEGMIGSSVFGNFGTNFTAVVKPAIGLKLDLLGKPVPPTQDIAPLISYDFAGGKAQNTDGSYAATVSNVQFKSISATLPGWGDLKSAAEFTSGSSLKIPVPATVHPMELFGVEAVVNITAASGRMNLVECQKSPFALFIEVRGGAPCLVGSVCDSRGWTSVATEKIPVPLNQWARLGMVFTGDDIVLLINGEAVCRRVISKATLVGFGNDEICVGVWPGGNRFQFVGQIAGLKIWNGMPAVHWPAIWKATQAGLGEIDSKYEELGGAGSVLGLPSGEEAAIGKGRYRNYQRGSIYWSPDAGAHEVHGAIFTHYGPHGGPTGSLGFPIKDELPASRPGARVSRFESGAIYWSPATGAREVHGAIFAHYLYKRGDGGFLGLPVSDEMNCANGQGRESRFQGGTIFWSSVTGACEVHGAILAKYLSLNGPAGFLGFPISDETDVTNSAGQPSGGKFSRFQGGTIYWSPASGTFEVHGDIRTLYEKLGGPLGSSKLGYPIGDETGVPGTDIRFNDFQNGIIVWKPGLGAQMMKELELRLGKVESGSIDDGIDFFKADRTAEVITYTTVHANGSVLDNGTRRPGDHAGSDYNINTKYTIAPIRSTTGIYLKIRVDDWDMITANDYLATYEQTFDIRSFWGQLGGDPPGVYSNQNSTARGGDAPGLSTIRFNFSIHKPPVIDPTKGFREQCWWRFDNFPTPTLSRQMFADVFSDVENVDNWWDEAMSPFDTAYYELAYKEIASKGNCFGISTEAVYALANQSLLVEPIYDYKAAPSDPQDATNANLAAGLKRLFNEKHGYQVGAQAINCILDQVLNLDVIQPLDVYDRVKYFLAIGDYPVLCMNDLSRGSGHCVMPYKCVDGAGSAPHRIYVGDPNKPWRGGAVDETYVEINKNNTFKTVNCPAAYASGTMAQGLLPSTFMEVIPYHVLRQQPRTPFWEIVEVLAFLLGGIIILAGDAETEELNNVKRSFYKTVGTTRHIVSNAVPGLGRIHLFDVAGKIPEIYAQKGRFPDTLEMKVKGKINGSATGFVRSASNAIRLNIPVSANARDTISFDGLQGSRPELRFMGGDKPRMVDVEYTIIKDKTERPRRTYKLNLGVAKDDLAIFRAARTGSGVEIKMAGPAQPLALSMNTLEGNRVVKSQFSYTPKSAGEIIRIRPRDAQGSATPLLVERLDTLEGRTLERQQITPRIL